MRPKVTYDLRACSFAWLGSSQLVLAGAETNRDDDVSIDVHHTRGVSEESVFPSASENVYGTLDRLQNSYSGGQRGRSQD